jgi:hypothetical protein
MKETETTSDPFGMKARYEADFGEPWSNLEKRVRSNPRNRFTFEMLDQIEWDEIEKKRLAALPFWKRLLRRTE